MWTQALAQAVSRRFLTAEARGRLHVTPCEICSGHTGTGAGAPSSNSVFPCHYHSTNAPHSSSPLSDNSQTAPQHATPASIAIFSNSPFINHPITHVPSSQTLSASQYKQTYGSWFILNLKYATRWNNNGDYE